MAPEENMRVLVVDDEPHARQGLVDMLTKKEEVGIVSEAENGLDAVSAILESKPDLVFLDIQMPGKTGIEVVQEIGPENMPVVIFVTAYDKYAIEAFDLAVVDYLLKPFDEERLDSAFDRARQLLALRELGDLRNRLVHLLKGHTSPVEPVPNVYLERIAVDMRGQIRIVSVDDIDYITASGSYAELHVGTERHLIRERMQALEKRLDPQVFFRVHRSSIVRLDRIDTILFSTGGDYAVRLKNGIQLKLGRTRRNELVHRLGLKY